MKSNWIENAFQFSVVGFRLRCYIYTYTSCTIVITFRIIYLALKFQFRFVFSLTITQYMWNMLYTLRICSGYIFVSGIWSYKCLYPFEKIHFVAPHSTNTTLQGRSYIHIRQNFDSVRISAVMFIYKKSWPENVHKYTWIYTYSCTWIK